MDVEDCDSIEGSEETLLPDGGVFNFRCFFVVFELFSDPDDSPLLLVRFLLPPTPGFINFGAPLRGGPSTISAQNPGNPKISAPL